MEKKSLLNHCRYYKGENVSPYEIEARTDREAQNKNMLWFYEKCWVQAMLQYYEIGEMTLTLKEYLSDYSFKMKDFSEDDGIPTSLKALLFNRYMRDSMDGNTEPFKEFYLKYYKNK